MLHTNTHAAVTFIGLSKLKIQVILLQIIQFNINTSVVSLTIQKFYNRKRNTNLISLHKLKNILFLYVLPLLRKSQTIPWIIHHPDV